MEKYKFENNKAVVDQPSIITISKTSVSIEHAGSTDTEDIPDAGLTIQVGNIESYNPTPINTEPVPEVNPTQPDNPGGSGEEPGGESGGDNEGGNSGSQEGSSASGGGTTPVVQSGNTCYVEQTGGNGIKYVIHNQTGIEARLSGGVVLNLSKNPNDWEGSTQAYAHMHAPTIGSSYAYNDIIIPIGGSYTSPTVTTITGIYQPDTNFLDGTWYFMNTERSLYMHSIFIYSRIWNNHDKESQGSNHMYWAVNPPQNAKLQNGITIHLFLTNVNPEATLQDASTGSGQSGHYVILDYQKTGLV